MHAIQTVLETLAGWVWGPATVVLLLGVGAYLTLRLRCVQVGKLAFAVRLLYSDRKLGESTNEATGDVSPLAALSVSLAAVIGNGNIAGVCTAIELGGPGAVFWMWCSAFFGMATKLVEALLGQRFKQRTVDGAIAGGPMYYIRDGLGLPWLAGVYALLMGSKALFSTSIVQANSISVAMSSQFGMPPLATGIILAAVTWLVIIGGLRSISRAAQILAPVMVLLYLGGAAVVLVQFASQIPEALRLVFVGALSPSAVGGGVAGATMATAMRYGLARGAYSNEAGTGTAGVFHAAARTSEPVRQGLLASLDVFLDTFVVCSLTALVVLTTGAWQGATTSTAMAADAFATAMPSVGGPIVAMSSLLFGFSSLVGIPYYGETSFAFLIGSRSRLSFRWVYCGLVLLGALLTVRIAWSLGDVLTGLMTIVNLIGVMGLSGLAIAEVQKYVRAQSSR